MDRVFRFIDATVYSGQWNKQGGEDQVKSGLVRVTPHSGGAGSALIFSFRKNNEFMKNKNKNELTLGDLITATYQVWGANLAEKMVRFALISRLVVVREKPQSMIFFAKGRSV
jgi:hypothetical protein